MSALTEWNAFAAETEAARRKPGSPPLVYFLAFIFVLFIGILIFCYAVTKRTSIIYLDQHGRPAAAGSAHSHH